MRRLFRIETLFALGQWAVSLMLASFLVGLGSLIIADLPRVDSPLRLTAFMDEEAVERLDAERAALVAERDRLGQAAEAGVIALSAARADADAVRETFQAWARTREATEDASRDAEVVERTRRLEAVTERQRQRAAELAAIETEQSAVSAGLAGNRSARVALERAARGPYQRAVFVQEARVFGLRLALTLPLLGISLWAIRRRLNSTYWPLWRGFVLFSVFVFFVELVPYLPSYGGYVRSGVGVLVTLLVGWWLVRAGKVHLARRAEAAAQAEEARRAAIAYEDALNKTAKNTCPSCDRTLRTTGDAPLNYCVHCGLKLYEPCANCGVRRLVFFPFCMSCGAAAPDAGAHPAPAPAPR